MIEQPHVGYDGQSQKNRLILTQSHIYCFKLFRSWLQIHMLIVMAFAFFTLFFNYYYFIIQT